MGCLVVLPLAAIATLIGISLNSVTAFFIGITTMLVTFLTGFAALLIVLM